MDINNENITILNDFIKKILNSNKNNNNLIFITLRFKDLYNNSDITLKSFKKIMGSIYYKLLGKNWVNKICKSIYVIENGKSGKQHVHAIINLEDITLDKFTTALDKVIKQCPWCNLCYDVADIDEDIKNWSPCKNHLLIRNVNKVTTLINYLLKELHLKNNHVDFSNFYLNDMFLI